MIDLRHNLLVSFAIALLGCGRGAGGHRGAPSASAPPASASASASSSASPPASTTAPAVPLDPPSPPPLTASFVGAKGEKGCKAQTVELASYQTRGEVALGGRADGVGATWRARISGKPQQQVAFASYDQEGRRVAAPRGVGLTMVDVIPRVFAAGTQWTVVWFDEKGLAFARPRVESLPPPDLEHVGAIGADVAEDVALATWPAGAVLAATPFGPGRTQLGLFLFAQADGAGVRALGVTHSGKAPPHHAAVAAGAASTFVVWDEGGALMGTRFDAADKENGSPCAIAPAGGEKRERVALAATGAGAVVMWMEGTRVRTRALDASGCPASPIWTVAEGRWASITSLGDTALVAWLAESGHLLAARLLPTGAPPERGLDASEGTIGIKDPPAVTGFGTGKAAFAWAEPVSPVISTKRILMRVVDAACVP